jgi:hypothetical protein
MSRTRTIATAGAVGLLAVTSIAGPTLGSSHREAPAIASDPSADITDLYAFVSPDKTDTVTIIANYSGFQEPAGGPNFYPFNPDVLYWIKVDNNGDGVQDITWTFRFTTDVADPDSFLYSGYGPIPGTDANVTQTYAVERNTEPMGSGLYVPPANIGPRTTPRYQAIAENAVNLLSDEATRVFAGQRDDPFFADLGAIFDLGGLRPFNGDHAFPSRKAKGQDDLSGFNVNTIAIQVPKSAISNDGTEPTVAGAPNAVIGIWAGASRQALSVDTTTPGEWVQVSRLGNPLINEVIIPLGRKDEWNASNPADDAQYEDYYLNPELARIINTVYPPLVNARTEDRTDLVTILGQGVPGVNPTNTTGLYDMLRLNMAIPLAKKRIHSILGAVGGDVAGFPNGRRLEDDVVDIELRAVADGYGNYLNGAWQELFPNNTPNNLVGDGCDANDARFLASFPYVATPWQGYKGGEYRRVCGKKK